MLGKLDVLYSLFPEYTSEMFDFAVTYDAVCKKSMINNTPELVRYVLGFAVFHDLTVFSERCPDLKLDKAVDKLFVQGFLLDDYDIRTKLGAYDGKKLLNTYDCPLRFVPTGKIVPRKYILAEKLSDFTYWANQQERVLKPDVKKYAAHNVAMGDMLPADKKIKQHKSAVGNPGLKPISDEAMHKIATRLALRKKIKNPDEVLLDMMCHVRYVKTM
ncbi:MAG: hypothetical protein ACLRFK_02810 [Alphaproteobacteria bacterium]